MCFSPCSFFQDNFLAYAVDDIKKDGSYWGASGGNQPYTPVASVDIAEAASNLLAHPEKHHGQTYLLTGPEKLTDTQIAAIATKVLGRTVTYKDRTVEEYSNLLKGFGTPAFIYESLAGLQGFIRSGYAGVEDPALERLLGHKARTFEQHLTDNKAKFA
jgi:uncharacterized protein YbjT (DUF2867 family)